MSHPQNVKLSLQSLTENRIQEISNAGRETFIKPLTLSESLTDLANRIDFLNVNESSSPDDDHGEIFSPKNWEGVRAHLQQALIEMNVLVDVLSIAQNKSNVNAPKESSDNPDAHRYLTYDVASKDPDTFNASFQILTKKKGLSSAAKILINGANRLGKASTDAAAQTDFHSELLKLRKRWRLRRVGEKIMGDLSYKTAGSDFWQNGAFEVLKKSPDEDDVENNENASQIQAVKTPIKVVVSSDLQGHASLYVAIINLPNKHKTAPGTSCSLTYFDMIQNTLSSSNEPLWHRHLCNAQNVLFCREMFMLLTKEAVQYKSSGMVSPFVVVGDVISCLIFSDTKLVVKLMYSKKVEQKANVQDDSNFFCLKHALLQLLQAYHSRRLNVSPSAPVTAVLGLKDKMRKAAINAWPGHQLVASYNQESESLAESLLKMTKHFEVRRRLCEVIDSLILQFDDPVIQSHWSMVSNMYESSVRVTIGNLGYESCYRSVVQLTAMPAEIKALQKEGLVSYLAVEESSLFNFFVSLICTHQLLSVQVLSKVIGWTLLQLSPQSGIGMSGDLLNRGTLLIASPGGEQCLSVVCSISTKGKLSYDVHVQFSKTPIKLETGTKIGNSFALEHVKLSPIRGEWQQVDWQNCQGKYFLEKMETILICLLTA